MIGDDHAAYAPRKGRNGKAETAQSVARYAARYSTRYETRPDESGDGEEAAPPTGGDEQARFRGWKKLRRARGMGFLGLDSQRAPMELWDVLWMNSLKQDDRWFRTEDARMSIAMDTFQAKLDERGAETGRKVNLGNARRLFFLAARDAGLGLSRRPDGTLAGFDLSGEILLRSDDEWMVVEAAEAEKMRVADSRGAVAPSAGALSFSATDPRNGPDGPPHGDDRPPG